MLPSIETCLGETGVIAIARGLPPGQAVPMAEALLLGGIRLMEITMNTEGAADIIQALRWHMQGRMHIGAGTVTTPDRCKAARSAGAQFIVTPNLDESIVVDCIKDCVPIFPGVLTPTEICRAVSLGCGYVKLFPAGTLSAAYVKDVLSALSDAKVLVVGGINSGNFGAYLQSGAAGAGIGGGLCKVPVDGQYSTMTAEAQALLKTYALNRRAASTR